MTYEDAIKTLEVAIAEVEWEYPMEYEVAFEMAISALRAQQEAEKNEPLTLDELMEIDREPVYIWYPYPQYGEWVIADGFNQYKNFTSTDDDSWYSGDYGKAWFAYRHPPKED